jgi:hypothetical protein
MTMTTYDEFKGYPTFDEIKNPILRNWNRLNVIFNMKEFLKNNDMVTRYMKKFDKTDQIAIGRLAIEIKKNGYENTRRSIIRANNA